jgi:hypothetical protein
MHLTDIVTSGEAQVRDRALDEACEGMTLVQLLEECDRLDAFRRRATNLYERVRALFFLYAIHRFHVPLRQGLSKKDFIPFEGYERLLSRRFEEAIEVFLDHQKQHGAGGRL